MSVESKDIVVAADRLFQQYGIRSVSIDDICRQLIISKKTFYVFFSQKEDLVDAVLTHRENVVIETLNQKISNKDAVQRAIIVLKGLKDMMSTYNVPVLMYDLQKYHRVTYDKHHDYRNEMMRKAIVHNLNQGIREGFYRPDIDIELISAFYSGNLRKVFPIVKEDNEKFTEERIVGFLIDMIMRFIVTDKGWERMKSEVKKIGV